MPLSTPAFGNTLWLMRDSSSAHAGIEAVFQQHFELSMASGLPGLSEKQTLVRRNPEIKSMATPSTRPNAHYWVLHYEETVSCGVAVCLTNYSVNAAHADNSSA